MRFLPAFFMLLTSLYVSAQQFTLPEPPAFLQNPFSYPYVPVNPDSLSYGTGLSNGDKILSLPTAAAPVPRKGTEDHRPSLMPLIDYLRSTAVSNPRESDYNGPEFELASGYRLRQLEDFRWQLFNPKLRPEGRPFDRLPGNQPFKDQYLACNREDCELLDAFGKTVVWAQAYDIQEFTEGEDLIHLRNGRLGLLSPSGKELLPPVAKSIRFKSDISYLVYLDNYEVYTLLPKYDLLVRGEYMGAIFNDRYLPTGTNLLDVKARRWLFAPGFAAHVFMLNPRDGILRISEDRPAPNLYPEPDTLKSHHNVIHLVSATGEYHTSVWSVFINSLFDVKNEWYDIMVESERPKAGVPGYTKSIYLDTDLNPISQPASGDGSVYAGPDSVHLVKADWEQWLVDRHSDTLFRIDYAQNLVYIGSDTILINQRIQKASDSRNSVPATLVFNAIEKRVVDTLPELRLLANGDFLGELLHLDGRLQPVNDEHRLTNALRQRRENTVYPYRLKYKCNVYFNYTYEGKKVIDDFGNDRFRRVRRIDDERSLLLPRGPDCSSPGYNVVRREKEPDFKVKRRYVQAYPIGRDGLLGYHYPEVCGGTGVTTADGAIVLDSTSAFVNRYDEKTGLLRIQFGTNYGDGEYLTFRGDFLFQQAFDRVDLQKDGSFIVKVGNLYGLYDRQGEILPPVFSQLGRIVGNVYSATLPGDRSQYLIRNGRLLH